MRLSWFLRARGRMGVGGERAPAVPAPLLSAAPTPQLPSPTSNPPAGQSSPAATQPAGRTGPGPTLRAAPWGDRDSASLRGARRPHRARSPSFLFPISTHPVPRRRASPTPPVDHGLGGAGPGRAVDGHGRAHGFGIWKARKEEGTCARDGREMKNLRRQACHRRGCVRARVRMLTASVRLRVCTHGACVRVPWGGREGVQLLAGHRGLLPAPRV